MRLSAQQKRLMQEVKHLASNPSEEYKAGPMENDMHTWHFTIRGPPDTEFSDGVYHGRIAFPFDYPMSPPDIYFLTKSGRFEVNSKICMTITQFHSEQWNASWTVRLMLEGIISLFPEKEKVMSVGSLNQTIEFRKAIAKESWGYSCEKCGRLEDILTPRQQQSNEAKKPEEADEVAEEGNEKVIEVINQEEVISEEFVQQERMQLEAAKRSLNQFLERRQQQDGAIDEEANEGKEEKVHYSQNHSDKPEANSTISFQTVLHSIEQTMNVAYSMKFGVLHNSKTQVSNKQTAETQDQGKLQLPSEIFQSKQEGEKEKKQSVDVQNLQIDDIINEQKDSVNSSGSVLGFEELQEKEVLTQKSSEEQDEELVKEQLRIVSKREVMSIDFMLFLTAVAFVLYLTFSFQLYY